jgi:putative ABC transport system ATP-binding protein
MAEGRPACAFQSDRGTPALNPLIELHNLTKTYHEAGRERVVLRDVNAVFREGEFVVLLGRSGSGKSTLLNLISGIDPPSAGRVVFNGVEVNSLTEKERTLLRRRHIGFIYQSFNLIPTLTAVENLLLPLELNGVKGAEALDRASAMLRELGLGDRAMSFPDRLSGGEQQRVAIARALVHDPLLVLADEPTGNLDLETGREVLDLLDRTIRAAGKTLVMVTHSREVIGLADRILMLRQGEIVESTS